MRTNIVLDPKLIARAMKKAGSTTMRETIDIALREYVSKPDYDALLKLGGIGTIDADYDPKAGAELAAQVAEVATAYRAGKSVRRRPARRPQAAGAQRRPPVRTMPLGWLYTPERQRLPDRLLRDRSRSTAAA